MAGAIVPVVLLFALLASIFYHTAATTAVTCRAGDIKIGQPASVSCNFHTDMSSSTKTIIVEHLPLSAGPDDVGTDVLRCEWESKTNRHKCKPNNGYTFDNVISDHLLLKIPIADNKHTGLYKCRLIPEEATYSQACSLDEEEYSTDKSSAATPCVCKCQNDLLTLIAICSTVTPISVCLLNFAVKFAVNFKKKRKSDAEEKDKNSQPSGPDHVKPREGTPTPMVKNYKAIVGRPSPTAIQRQGSILNTSSGYTSLQQFGSPEDINRDGGSRKSILTTSSGYTSLQQFGSPEDINRDGGSRNGMTRSSYNLRQKSHDDNQEPPRRSTYSAVDLQRMIGRGRGRGMRSDHKRETQL